MKALKIFGHPITVISMFLLVIIEGVHFGGFYVMYLLFGLMYAATFALVAVAGIAVLILAYNLSPLKRPLMKPALYLVGWLLLILSYVLFFYNRENNHNETFETTVPFISFLLLGACSLCFLINVFQLFVNRNGNTRRDLRTA